MSRPYFTNQLKSTLSCSSKTVILGNKDLDDPINQNINMSNHKIINLSSPTNPKDAVNKEYVDNKRFTSDLSLSSTGPINMNNNAINNLPSPVNPTDAVNKEYVDDNTISAAMCRKEEKFISISNLSKELLIDVIEKDCYFLSISLYFEKKNLSNTVEPVQNSIDQDKLYPHTYVFPGSFIFIKIHPHDNYVKAFLKLSTRNQSLEQEFIHSDGTFKAFIYTIYKCAKYEPVEILNK